MHIDYFEDEHLPLPAGWRPLSRQERRELEAGVARHVCPAVCDGVPVTALLASTDGSAIAAAGGSRPVLVRIRAGQPAMSGACSCETLQRPLHISLATAGR